MPRDTRTVPLSLRMLRFSPLAQAIDEVTCLDCGAYLDLHQPDAEAPDRLVGICRRCGHWYVIDLAPGADEATMVLLPEAGAFRDACTPPADGDLHL